jgi:hypothetical protein
MTGTAKFLFAHEYYISTSLRDLLFMSLMEV